MAAIFVVTTHPVGLTSEYIELLPILQSNGHITKPAYFVKWNNLEFIRTI
jgi:hypothetical protein